MTQSSQLGLTFFGLTPDNAPEARINVFSVIHEIVFNGKGGYDWETVYNMPIWLRNFTFKKMREHYDNEASQIKKSQGKSNGSTTLMDSDGKVQVPEHLKNVKKSSPTYVTKASKK